jgi:hypothetical protein
VNVLDVINNHIPSISDADEVDIADRIQRWMIGADDDVDVADLALRTCNCGLRITGFYEYVDHLKAMIEKETSRETCARCGSPLDEKGLCTDETCPYSDRPQGASFTED